MDFIIFNTVNLVLVRTLEKFVKCHVLVRTLVILYAILLVRTQRFFTSLVLVFNQRGCQRYVPVNFRVLTPNRPFRLSI